MTISSIFNSDLKVINVGTSMFAEQLKQQDVSVEQVQWQPVAAGNKTLIDALNSTDNEDRHSANQEALSRYLAGEPFLVDYCLAKDVIPGFEDHMLLHAGPPISWERMCGPMRGAIMGAIIFEGWAKTPEEAAEYAASGKVKFSPCHEHDAVGPMAGVIAPHMVVSVFENRRFGNRAYCPVPEGMGGKLLRYGAYSQEVIDRLHWIQKEFREVMHAALATCDGVDTKSLQFQALHMGDEGHNRNKAGTSMFIRAVVPLMIKSGLPAEKILPVLDFINGNDGFYLSISMPTSKVTLDPCNGVKGSSMVTAMARNGVDFGIRVAGLPGEWFVGPSQKVRGLYFPGYGDDDANLDMGDSSITETAGLGGFALSGAPAIVQLVGGTAAEGVEISKRMYEITIGENMNFSQPVLNFRGSPTGIDICLVVETGVLPTITTGSVHKLPGEGQIGAGITNPPIECFEKALLRFAEVYGQ